MKRGDLYWADLHPQSGSEQSGQRPVLPVSHDLFNSSLWNTVIAVPLWTSKAQAKRGPTGVLPPNGTGGLERNSVALCHQVTTLDKVKLRSRIGTLGSLDLRRVESGIRIAMDL